MEHPILIEADSSHLTYFEVDDYTYSEILRVKTNRYLMFVFMDFWEAEPVKVEKERIHLLH